MRFSPNPAAFEEIRRQPTYDAHMGDVAGAVADQAAIFTPRGPDKRRGHFADRFAVEWIDGVPCVGNTDKSFYHLIEFGSANNTPSAPLRRAVSAVGLRLDEDPK